jgi:hypothetical protein
MTSQLAASPVASIPHSGLHTAEWARSVKPLIRTIQRLSRAKVKDPIETTDLAHAKQRLNHLICERGSERDRELLAAYKTLTAAVSRAIRPFVADENEAQSMGKLSSLATSLFERIGRHSVGRNEVERAERLIAELNEPIPVLEVGRE